MGEAVKTEWAEMTKDLPPNESSRLVAQVPELVKQAVAQLLPPALDRALQKMGYSSEVAGLLHLLAAKSDDNREGLLRKALTLYNVALDAKDNGNRLAILNPEDVIVREIVGFEQADHTPQPVTH
jgi:hypothetical protein